MFFSVHNHTEYSNLRMRDSINKIEDLMDRANELGYCGMALTDHEALSGAVRGVSHYYKKYADTDFKLALGNEIYLVDDIEYMKENGGKYNHFILLAKNEKGWEQIRKLSSQAWSNYFVKGVERVPLEKEQLKRIIGSDKGHLVATTACLGGEFGQLVCEYIASGMLNIETKRNIHEFLTWCVSTFGKDNFYIELAPSLDEEQIVFNKMAIKIANGYGLKYILATDSHYLKKEDRKIHSAFINAGDMADNERDSFYLYSYMQTMEEIRKYSSASMSEEEIKTAIENTRDIYDKIEMYDIRRPTKIPQMNIPKHEVKHIFEKQYDEYEYIKKFAYSPYEQDTYHLYLIEKGFIKKKQKKYSRNLEAINTELKTLWEMSEKLGQRLSSYLNLMTDVVDSIWHHSYLGVGRGSAGGWYGSYLIDLVHINPLKYNLKHWRFLNIEKVSFPDIDVDLAPSKRPKVIEELKLKNGEKNVIQTATFKTEGSKSAVQTVARGLGINNDEASAIASLIKSERGQQWSLSDCLYGNEKEERKPITEFKNLVNQYEGLEEAILKVEGLISGRSIHASAVYLFKEEGGYLDNGLSMMRSGNGTPITCFSMYDVDAVGGMKIDLLVTDAMDKLMKTVELLEEDGLVEKGLSLKEQYDKYLHPDILEYDDQEMWSKLHSGEILDVFQFQTDLAIQALKKTKPINITEMAQVNTLMRLSSEDGEQPMDTFVRFKADISQWYKEMVEFGLSEEEIKIMEEHLLELKGVCDTQEALMTISMDKRISAFTMSQADGLRKILAKKLTKEIAGARENFIEQGLSIGTREVFLRYVWDVQFKRLMKYSFNLAHTTSYSAVGLQELNLYHKYNPIYWNTSVLICNSGSVDEEQDGNTNYGKVATAIGNVMRRGVTVALPNINNAGYTFSPDVMNNRIYYGLFAISGINQEIAHYIINNRPYSSLNDFIEKTQDVLKNTHYLALIKAGAFDELEGKSRIEIMRNYLDKSVDKVTQIDGRHVIKMLNNKLTPYYNTLQARFLKFRNYIFSQKFEIETEYTTKNKKFYQLDHISEVFFEEYFTEYCTEGRQYFYNDNGLVVNKNTFDTVFKKVAKDIVEWTRTEEALEMYNKMLVDEELKSKYSSIAQWEIESLNYYYSGHIMDNCELENHGIEDFFDLSETPRVKEVKKSKKGFEYNIYNSYRIAGTVVHKDKNKHVVYLLTPTGVVPVKYRDGVFSHYDKQISEVQPDGKKKVLSKSWFGRHTHLMIEGYRRDDQFIPYVDKSTGAKHTTMRVVEIKKDREYPLTMEYERPRVNKK